MRFVQTIRLLGFFLLLSALPTTAGAAAVTAAPAKGRAIPVSVTSTLKNRGVSAGWAEVNPDNPLMVSVYLTFTHPFGGKIELRGFTSAGAEAARSIEKSINITEETGRPEVFTFPVGSDLSKATRLIVVGEDGLPTPPPKQKRNESVGEEAKDIFNELIR